MANLLKEFGKLQANYNQRISDPFFTGYANKAWRAAILLHRATHGPEEGSEVKKGTDSDPARGQRPDIKKVKRDQQVKADIITRNLPPDDTNNYREEPNDKRRVSLTVYQNRIDVTNRILQKINHDVIIYNIFAKPVSYIVLQNRPNSIDFKGETTWAIVKSMGRNLPMYHYTGAEDIIQFNISWYANDPDNNEEVVTKCRLLESWTKANAYQAAPPVLTIDWGGSDLYKNQYFILISATYTLNNFSQGSRLYNSSPGHQSFIDGKLLPLTATQELIFKRVSATNPSWEDIIPKEKIDKTRNINRRG